MHGKTGGGERAWSVLLDPSGAAFGVIPTVACGPDGSPRDAASSPPTGRIAWLDLTVADASATRDFYRDVVGWTVEDVAMEDGDVRCSDYSLTTPDGTAVAGVCHARGVNRHIPPVRSIYLPVGDLDESLRRVPREGGEVIEARDGPEGRCAYAFVRDPVGAHVALAPG